MDTQNLKADKLDLMGWIYSVHDQAIIDTLKGIQRAAILSTYESSLKPMTQKELVDRAEIANRAIDNQETTNQDDLRNEINSW